MRNIIVILCMVLFYMQMWGCSCKKDPGVNPEPPLETGGFPTDIAKILVTKCATSGCHNDASSVNAAGLRLDTWTHLFEGGANGAEVIPYSPEFSPLLYFVNTDPNRGTTASPTMPFDATGSNPTPLSDEEYNTLKQWIAEGAPDVNGNIAFTANADTRQKIYLSQQGCDLIAVIDAESNLVMRYIKVGTLAGTTESPHCVRFDNAGKYAYVSFLNGTGIQKMDASLDNIVNTGTLGTGSWNIVFVAPNDTMLVTSDWADNGRVLYANTNTMNTVPELTGSGAGLFVWPHGIASDAAFDTCFITGQYGNVVFRWAPKASPFPSYRKISIDGKPPVATNNTDKTSPNPHEIMMTPDRSKYFLTCEGTNEVRVMNAHTDEVMDAIPVGAVPQEIAMSYTKPLMFVTCMEDVDGVPAGRKGSVYVINYNTHVVEKVLKGDFYQPHGITVDDRYGKIYIASTNSNPDGPAPHHATACGGRAGWYSVYSLNTLEPLNSRRYQVTVMPYSADVRFKTP